ncbi:IS200/IS605 family element transposase accessory protein TnpB [Hassallia byssoidea VB512170]|uniref:IS200/IS605 family element transposase accessory protein TnpB n=1 Tax=Hassallia byssoidea VB512170 TaxID=1304833 RepID=A0A846H542_9CYAN|nr:RNA-guided endonuclease TnpB family protein [Hassalia byssoidea]NEU72462.1 IS200/IS605 family element transposase accessory protein TnpB [Hassalia byssoidea VB512170]
MYRAYKFRLYPTPEQQVALAKSFGCCRWFWNHSLNLCQETYKSTGKGLSRGAIQGLLPALKKEYPWLTDAYSQCLQYVALNLSTAYKNFFEKRAGFPKFKSKHGRQSISYPANVKLDGDYLKLPGKVGSIYCRQDREVAGKFVTTTISQNTDGKYYVAIIVDDGKAIPEASTDGKAVGIDLGLTHFCITSNGSKFDNPRHTKRHAKNLKKKQQSLARKQKGSLARAKAKRLVAKVHSRVSRVREDFLHKLSRKIVNENQVIAVENLCVKGMVRSHNFALAISDCGWGQFCTMLKYKAEWEGKTYTEIDRFFPSSKLCSVCLNKVDSLPLDIRAWTCDKCQTHHDRDINAAINIRNEALRILDLGTRSTANGGNVSQPGKTSVLLDAVPIEVGNPIRLAVG